MQLVPENVHIAALRPCRHCLSYKRKGLMMVETTELYHLAVQFEAVVCELRVPETEAARVFVNDLPSAQQSNANNIQVMVLKIPQFYTRYISKMENLRYGTAFGRLGLAPGACRGGLRNPGDRSISVQQFGFEGQILR